MTGTPHTLSIEDLAEFSLDPAGFLLWAFPWGEPGTELALEAGPSEWQMWVAVEIGKWLQSGLCWEEAFRLAIASGHGVGKSADVSWMILWAFSTQENTRGVVTANTETQLRTKTWAELSKWFRLFIAKEFFELQSTKLCAKDPAYADTWRIDRVTWSEDNTEAFAGLHNKGSRILVVFDEASGIATKVWEVTNGALTDANTQIIWLAYGNPTQPSGGFFDCFHSKSHRWRTRRVDSRTVSITNEKEIAAWIEDYGIDSDYVRVRVLGEFPRSSALEFIGKASIEGAQKRLLLEAQDYDSLVMGVDVARQGEDHSVIFFRRGLDARSIPPIVIRIPNLMTLAGIVAEKFREHRADGIFVDEGGMGAGVVDRLRQLGVPCHGILFQSTADLPPREGEARYYNKRAEMWGSMRRWLATGAIPEDEQLAKELNGPLYSVSEAGGGARTSDSIILERKRDLKSRLGFSPDIADALALTFAYPVFSSRSALTALGGPSLNQVEYDPIAMLEAF